MRPPRATTNSPGSCQGLSTSALSVPRRADRPTSSASASSPGCHASRAGAGAACLPAGRTPRTRRDRGRTRRESGSRAARRRPRSAPTRPGRRSAPRRLPRGRLRARAPAPPSARAGTNSRNGAERPATPAPTPRPPTAGVARRWCPRARDRAPDLPPAPAGWSSACASGPPASRPAIPLLPPAPGPQPCSSRRRHARQRRDDLAAVDLDLLLLVAVHEVEVELVDAGRGQFAQLADVVVRGSQDAEAVGPLVAHEAGIGRADLGVVEVVVAGAVLDVARQRRGQLLARVLVDEVQDVVGDERWEPARPLTPDLPRPDVRRRRRLDLEAGGGATRGGRRVAQLAHEPADEVRVGELQDQPGPP